jgi:hypothetical protein
MRREQVQDCVIAQADRHHDAGGCRAETQRQTEIELVTRPELRMSPSRIDRTLAFPAQDGNARYASANVRSANGTRTRNRLLAVRDRMCELGVFASL